ncbi:hypothetical protein VR010_12340 [Actinomycetaceae bacterium L2_0104]
MTPSSSAPSSPHQQYAAGKPEDIAEFIDGMTSRVVIAIDGRSGAGKTTLAREIARELELRWHGQDLRAATPEETRSLLCLEVENFVEGWSGLTEGVRAIAEDIVAPFRKRGWVTARPWDWHRERWGTELRFPETGTARVLLLVGCGSSSGPLAPLLDASVWIDASEALRRSRVAAREGDPSRWWDLWAAQESELLAEHDSPAHATWRI